MVSVLDRQVQPAQAVARAPSWGWPAVAGAASLAAGAIHAAAIGVHSEHEQAGLVFTGVAVAQLSLGALLLARPTRRAAGFAALASLGFIGAWGLAKTRGIWFIDGLEAKEPIQTADGLAAALAALVVLAAIATWLRVGERDGSTRPLRLGALALLVATAGVPGMVSAGTHAHAEGDAHGAVVADDHDAGDGHGSAGDAEPASSVAPMPYDPALPIDLGGVEGVTPQEQARAENLLAISLVRLPKFADPTTVEAMGFVSIGDGFLGHEHYLNAANMNDDRILDPDYPESLVFDTSVTPKRLAAAMFMMNPGDTLADVPEVGGKLTQWHVHDNLCFSGPRVAGLTDAEGNCAAGLTKGAETPMIHVWIVPHPCGPFAALEGVAGGTVAAGEERLCDHAHGA